MYRIKRIDTNVWQVKSGKPPLDFVVCYTVGKAHAVHIAEALNAYGDKW